MKNFVDRIYNKFLNKFSNRFIDSPFIPGTERKVKIVAVDIRTPIKILKKFEDINIIPILITPSKNLNFAVSGHPDMLIHPLGNNLIVVSPDVFDELVLKFKPLGFKIIKGETHLKSNYPQDIAYNIARIDKFAFHNFKYTDRIIRAHFEKNNIKEVQVNQGYSKCSTCIVNKKAVITSDKGMAKAFDNYNFDVLLIKPGFIKLHGLNYGFIGGATGLISKDTLAVAGSLVHHPDMNKIFNFCSKHNVKILELGDENAIDIGSIIPLL